MLERALEAHVGRGDGYLLEKELGRTLDYRVLCRI